jgi:hypothetical protein
MSTTETPDQEPTMTDTRGLAGDRRRNPFPSLNDTEYALWVATMREEIRGAVEAGMEKYRKDNCLEHQSATERLRKEVYGNGESGLCQRVEAVEGTVAQLRRVTWTAVSALIIGFIGLLIGLVQFAILRG